MRRFYLKLKEKVDSITRFLWQKAYQLFSPNEVSISYLYTNVPLKRNKIPNTVFQTWKAPVLPSLNALGVRRFRNNNQDYSFQFFDDQRMSHYMESCYSGHAILRAFRQVRIPAARADIWRYCILYREGGIYCDIDSALSIPFRELLKENVSELISFERNSWKECLDLTKYGNPDIFLRGPSAAIRRNLDFPDNMILNWLLCFEKGSPILEEVINLIARHFPFFENRVFDNMLKAVLHCTGPMAFSQAVWMWMEKTRERPHQLGIDFEGFGISKLAGSDKRYEVSPHYETMAGSKLTQS